MIVAQLDLPMIKSAYASRGSKTHHPAVAAKNIGYQSSELRPMRIG